MCVLGQYVHLCAVTTLHKFGYVHVDEQWMVCLCEK